MGTLALRRSRQMLSSAAGSVIETLESRQLLSITPVTLSNGLASTSPDYFSVELDGGGSTRTTSLGGTDTIYDYFSYLDAGGSVYNLMDYSDQPTLISAGKAVSHVTLNLAGGGTIKVTITSELPAGSKTLVNRYDLSATGYDLRNVRLHQYMDADIEDVGDDVLTVSGSIYTGDLVLTTIDPATSKRQAQSPGGVMVGGYLSGWGADKWHDLRDAILAGGYNPSASGTIDTTDLPSTYETGIGSGWGAGDITTTLTYKFTAVSQATVSSVLGVRNLQMNRPIIVLPDFLGSMPTQDTWGSFLAEFANGQGHQPTSLSSDPMLGAYEPLMRLMDDTLGYDRNVDLFFGAYDWRRPIAPTDGVADGQLHLSGINFGDSNYQYGVEYLRYWIEQARGRWSALHGGSTTGFSVDIVGHGMGGLIARAFMQSDYFQSNYAGQVHRMVTLGTPHEGMVNAYLWLEPGIGPDQVAQQASTLTSDGSLVSNAELELLWRMARDVNGSGLSIGSAIPSLYNLTPTFSFVSSSGGTTPSQGAYRNTLLLDLNANASAFASGATGGVVLAGSRGLSTPASVVYTTGGPTVQFNTDGDGTVLWSSASFANGRPSSASVPAAFTASHIALFSAATVQPVVVRDYLGLTTSSTLTPIVHPWLETATGFTFGYISSADFLLTNSQGQRLGYTSTYGYLNEMAGAYYSGYGSYQLFLIPSAQQDGSLNLSLQGVGSNYLGTVQRSSTGGLTGQNLSGYLANGGTQQVTVAPAPAPVVHEQPLLFGIIAGKKTKQVITEPDGDKVTFELSAGIGELYGYTQGSYQIVLGGTTAASALKISLVRGTSGDGWAEVTSISDPGLLKSITAPAVYITADLVLNNSALLVPATASVAITLGGLLEAHVDTHGLPIKSLSMLAWYNGGQLRAPSIGTLSIKGRKENPKTPASEWLAGDCDGEIILQGNPSALLLKSVTVTDRLNGNITVNGGIGKITANSFAGQIRGAYIQSVTTKSKTDASTGSIIGQGSDAKGLSIGKVAIANDLTGGRITANGRIQSVAITGKARNSRIQATGNVDSLSVGYLLSTDVLVGVAASFTGRFAGASSNYPATTALLKSFTVRGASLKAGQHPDYITDSYISAANIGTMSLKDTDDLGGLKVYFLDYHTGSPKQVTYTNPNTLSKLTWRYGQVMPGGAESVFFAV